MEVDGALFGTDGIRGRFGTDPITPAFAFHLGYVLASKTLEPQALVCVGRDTRASSKELAFFVMAGLMTGGATVEDLFVFPTPGVSHAAETEDVSLGVAITASHNPYEFNGFKLFTASGDKMDVAAEQQLEALLRETPQVEIGGDSAQYLRQVDHRYDYLELLEQIAEEIGKTQLTGIVDCANGATTESAVGLFEPVFKEAIYIGDKPNGFNINDGVGSTSIDFVRNAVVREQADIGIAFDGDGDRVLFIDETGSVVNGDQILYVLANQRLECGYDGVVGTNMSNHGLAVALDNIDIEFVRTNVGDRYVANELEKRGWQLGGEPSGHVIWHELLPTGDGVLTALAILEVMIETGSRLCELVAPVQMLPQQLRNVTTSDPQALMARDEVKGLLAEFAERIGYEGRLLVRASGTEPVVRVMVEHVDESTAIKLAGAVAREIQTQI